MVTMPFRFDERKILMPLFIFNFGLYSNDSKMKKIKKNYTRKRSLSLELLIQLVQIFKKRRKRKKKSETIFFTDRL